MPDTFTGWKLVKGPGLLYVDPGIIMDWAQQDGRPITLRQARQEALRIYRDSEIVSNRWSHRRHKARGPHPFYRKRHQRMAGK